MGDAAGSPKLNLFEERDDSPDTFMRGQRLFEENDSPRSGDVNLRQIMMGDEGSRSAAIREQQKYNPQPQQGPPSYNQPSVWPGGAVWLYFLCSRLVSSSQSYRLPTRSTLLHLRFGHHSNSTGTTKREADRCPQRVLSSSSSSSSSPHG